MFYNHSGGWVHLNRAHCFTSLKVSSVGNLTAGTVAESAHNDSMWHLAYIFECLAHGAGMIKSFRPSGFVTQRVYKSSASGRGSRASGESER